MINYVPIIHSHEKRDHKEQYHGAAFQVVIKGNLTTYRLIPDILGHVWTFDHSWIRETIELSIKKQNLTKKDVKNVLKVYFPNDLKLKENCAAYCFRLGAIASIDPKMMVLCPAITIDEKSSHPVINAIDQITSEEEKSNEKEAAAGDVLSDKVDEIVSGETVHGTTVTDDTTPEKKKRNKKKKKVAGEILSAKVNEIIRIEQYFLMTDYSLWEVILNGDSSIPTRVIDGVVQPVAPTTAEQRLAKMNELKAQGTLLMALLDKHQLKFNIHKDAKSLMEAIEEVCTTKSVSAVTSVSAANTKVHVSALPNVDTLSDAVIYSFFASQSNSLQLDNDDLKQIDADDLEEIYLKWHLGFDMSKVECYNCHRRWYFTRECRSPKDTRNKETQRRNVPADEEPTNYAPMAFTSLSSLSSDNENENVFEEDIKLLKLNVMLRDNALVELSKKFKKAEQERDKLKLKLENFQTYSKNLSKLLASQITDKTGLGYYNHVFNSAVFGSDKLISFESDVSMPTSPVYDSQLGILPLSLKIRFLTQKMNPRGNLQHALKDKGVTDSGCSRHMTGNISYLSDFEEINGGYVAFGGNPKGGKITCKDTECIVLSSDFKLPDDNHVLLRVHRENNMYNVDLKNIVPSGDLTCLFAKDTLDESNNGTEFKNQDLNQFGGMKGIKREFSVARTPQQNRIAERKNMTLIKAARTMLANSLLPIPFWAEVVNTACYVQNRVLVTKPHNKTPYELLLGRSPIIGFMRPFGCLVTILNTLDPLGKFDRKADEGFLVGYSVSSKAFRIFNSRTRIVQETLNINFLENQPNIARSRPTWLFDIDTLTQSMNYQLVVVGNQPNSSTGIQQHFDADKAEEGNVQQYVLFPLWSTGSKDPQSTDADTTFEVKELESEVHVSPSSSDKTKKHDDKTKREAKGKSHVELSTGA
nr:retrovirus-related Pol polyprotein from transposon TNT 1-94 [Tanacetum cinerariifolium]